MVRILTALPRILFENNLPSIYCVYKFYEYRGNPNSEWPNSSISDPVLWHMFFFISDPTFYLCPQPIFCKPICKNKSDPTFLIVTQSFFKVTCLFLKANRFLNYDRVRFILAERIAENGFLTQINSRVTNEKSRRVT